MPTDLPTRRPAPPKGNRHGNLALVAAVTLMFLICGVTAFMHRDDWPGASSQSQPL